MSAGDILANNKKVVKLCIFQKYFSLIFKTLNTDPNRESLELFSILNCFLSEHSETPL